MLLLLAAALFQIRVGERAIARMGENFYGIQYDGAETIYDEFTGRVAGSLWPVGDLREPMPTVRVECPALSVTVARFE